MGRDKERRFVLSGDYQMRIMDILTREKLYEEYIINKQTTTQIAEKYGCDSSYIGILNRKYGYSLDMWYEDFKLTDLQYDLIIGGVLGDGCVTKRKDMKYYNYYECHAENQKEYLQFKFDMLSNLCKSTGIKLRSGDGYNVQPLYYFNTRNLPCFGQFKKLNNFEVFEKLNDNSFAIWLMDDGVFYKNERYCRLGYTRFTEEETDYVIDILYKKFNVLGIHNWQDKEHTKLWGITFRKEETKNVFDIINSCEFNKQIRETMSYKMIY